jgi:hypothetical protein
MPIFSWNQKSMSSAIASLRFPHCLGFLRDIDAADHLHAEFKEADTDQAIARLLNAYTPRCQCY